MKRSNSEAMQMIILYSTAAKTSIRECYALMKRREFAEVERKMQDITELLEQTRMLERKLLENQAMGDEAIEESRLLYASTHLLSTTILFETAVKMKQLYKLGFSC